MNLDVKRKNSTVYLKEFKKSIPNQKLLLRKNINVDISSLGEISNKIEVFYQRGLLISPMSIDKSSINIYTEDIDLVKQFPSNFQPDVIMEAKILEQTKSAKNTRRILLPSVVEENTQLMENYDKMIAYYLLMGGDNPIERFSKVEMSMKQYGVKPDIRNIYNEIWR